MENPETAMHYRVMAKQQESMPVVAELLISLRKQLNLTQKELGNKVGMSQPQIARLESGRFSPSLKTLVKIATLAGYKLEIKLVDEEE